jgi:hypothetical protein
MTELERRERPGKMSWRSLEVAELPRFEEFENLLFDYRELSSEKLVIELEFLKTCFCLFEQGLLQ